MPHVQAFRGLRYDLGHVGSLGNVLAPPPELIDAETRDQLYERHPANIVRLILNRVEPGDDEHSNPDQRAARFLKNWRSEGLLMREADPSLYVYHQAFDHAGRHFTRRGFICLVRMPEPNADLVTPLEDGRWSDAFEITPSLDQLDSRAFRRARLHACHANLNPILGLYDDSENSVQHQLDASVAGHAPIEATDADGVVHRVWTISDVGLIAKIAAAMDHRKTLVAEGHREYAALLDYRAEALQRGDVTDDQLRGGHPANFAMMNLVSLTDGGLVPRVTHRFVRGLAGLTSAQLETQLEPWFACRDAGSGVEESGSIGDRMATDELNGQLACYTPADGRWIVARVTTAGMEQLVDQHSDAHRERLELPASCVDELLLPCLGDPPESVECERGLGDAWDWERRMAADDAKDNYGLGILVSPPSNDHVQLILEQGDRLPLDSCRYLPTQQSGLILNPFS